MFLKLVFFVELLVVLSLASPLPSSKDNLRRREATLDPDGKYTVGWEVDLDSQMIYFDVTVQTTGFVGFGISPNGGMEGADIVIGGVNSNNNAYFTDRYGVHPMSEPIVDDEQNWVLLTYSQDTTRTMLRFARLLDTLDDQDVVIQDEMTNFIWSYGPTDIIEYHNSDRGTFPVNILDPLPRHSN